MSNTEKELEESCKCIADELDDIASGVSEQSIHDYFEDALDIRFEVDMRRELCGGKILVACGGPNIWVYDDRVVGYWGASSTEYYLTGAAKDAVYDYLFDLYNL